MHLGAERIREVVFSQEHGVGRPLSVRHVTGNAPALQQSVATHEVAL
jgi:hypothetical protein